MGLKAQLIRSGTSFGDTGVGGIVKIHHYQTTLRWTGNYGSGTATYKAYSRNHEHSAPGKSAPIPGSSDPHFRGDATRYNPEELLVASLSSCHMLWYLHHEAAKLCFIARSVRFPVLHEPTITLSSDVHPTRIE